MSEQLQPRVLHIGKYLPPVPGGIETYLGDLLRVSMRHGLEVGAVVHGKKGYPDPNPADFGGAKIYTVPTYGQVLYAPVAPMFPWVLRKAIREFKPDILHMHVPNTSAFWALFIPEAQKIPWVLHWHADVDVGKMSPAMRAAYRAYKPFENELLRKSKLVVATSEEYLAASKALQPWADKCQVIPLGIDIQRLIEPTTDQIEVAAKLWPRSSEVRFLAVGRLTYYKNYGFLIRALANTEAGSLVIVGDGEMKAELHMLVIELGLTDRVKLVGALSALGLASCYAAADVFCMTSVDRSEAFGLVLLEAACFRCNVLALEISGSATGSIARSLGGAVGLTSTEFIDALRASSEMKFPREAMSRVRFNKHVRSRIEIDSWRQCYERLSA